MSRLLIKNVKAVQPYGTSPLTNVLVIDGKIAEISDVMAADCTVIDANGAYLFPGFVDVHVHGGGGADFMDGTPAAFETAVKAHLSHGTTTLLPTAMSASQEELIRFINAYHDFCNVSSYGAHTPGLHLEGPYFSNANAKSKGAQNGNVIRKIDFAEVDKLLDSAQGSILRWDAAPEIENSVAFAKKMRDAGVVCAAGHSDATGYEAQAGFEAGFSHVTHFYNACSAYRKREQIVTAGIVEAAYLDDSVTVELICDGKHIPEHCLRLALKVKGHDNVIGITDAMRLSCTEQTSGKLGSLNNGTNVIVDDNVAKLPDMSSYAGSVCTMERALQVLCIDYKISPVIAAKLLSTNPAKHIGMGSVIGSIEVGKDADLVVVDSHFCVCSVIKKGKLI